jgi:hypothetical protein
MGLVIGLKADVWYLIFIISDLFFNTTTHIYERALYISGPMSQGLNGNQFCSWISLLRDMRIEVLCPGCADILSLRKSI